MRKNKEIERILIVRTDRLGDVVLTLPILPILRSRFPNAHLAMLLKRYTGEIAEGNPYVDELIWYDHDSSPIPFMEMCSSLRQRRFDAAIVVYPRLRLALLMRCAGIPVRIGTGYRYYSFLFSRRVYDHRRTANHHEVEYNLRLARELGCDVSGKPEFVIRVPEEARERVSRLVPHSSPVVLHPGSGGSAREWPPAYFGELARKLLDAGEVVFVTGSEAERAKVDAVVKASGGKATSLCGSLSVKELAALFEKTRLFVSNSTGPIHIAAAVGTPVIGLYPRQTVMSAKRWGPWTDRKMVFVPAKPEDCSECSGRVKTPCACMESIPAEQVFRGAVELMSGYRSGSSAPRGGNA